MHSPTKFLLALATFAFLNLPVAVASPSQTIKIGVLASFTGLPNEAKAFQNGTLLAQEEINAKGGVLGRPLEAIFRDDKNAPTDAIKEAARLDQEDKVSLLIGTFLDNTGQAVLNYAGQAKLPFIKPTGGTDLFVWGEGNRYGFRNDTSTDTLGHMLAEEAAKNPAKRWAVLAPNYEYGHAMYASFKKHMAALRPDVQWVGEQFSAYGKLDAGSTVQALRRAKPDAVLMLLFYDDLVKFTREAQRRGVLKDLFYTSPYMGWPEALSLFGREAPAGWLTNGFPYQNIAEPKVKAFIDAYQARFHEPPGATSMNGYTTLLFAAAALDKAGAEDREKITDALAGLSIASPMGTLTMREADHQSNFGAWIGTTAIQNGEPTLSPWRYKDAAPYFPSDAAVRALRPAGGK